MLRRSAVMMTEGNHSTDDLIGRVRSGDADALAEAFRRHQQRLDTIVRFRLDRRLQRRIGPDDVLQEAFLNASKRCGHVEGDSPQALFVWLRMIVLQTVVDITRRHLGAKMRDVGREEPAHRAVSAATTSVSLAARLIGNMTSPSGAVRRAERSEQLQSALDGMDTTDREVLALRHFEELSNQEVATVLDINQKAASIRYVRALRRLKDILGELPGLDLSRM